MLSWPFGPFTARLEQAPAGPYTNLYRPKAQSVAQGLGQKRIGISLVASPAFGASTGRTLTNLYRPKAQSVAQGLGQKPIGISLVALQAVHPAIGASTDRALTIW